MNFRNKLTIAVLAIAALAWIAFVARPRRNEAMLTYSQFIQRVQAGQVVEVKISAGNSGPDAASVRLKNGETVRTLLPLDYSGALATMQQAMVNVEIQDASASPARLAISATPFLILLAVWIYFMTIGRPLLGRRQVS